MLSAAPFLTRQVPLLPASLCVCPELFCGFAGSTDSGRCGGGSGGRRSAVRLGDGGAHRERGAARGKEAQRSGRGAQSNTVHTTCTCTCTCTCTTPPLSALSSSSAMLCSPSPARRGRSEGERGRSRAERGTSTSPRLLHVRLLRLPLHAHLLPSLRRWAEWRRRPRKRPRFHCPPSELPEDSSEPLNPTELPPLHEPLQQQLLLLPGSADEEVEEAMEDDKEEQPQPQGDGKAEVDGEGDDGYQPHPDDDELDGVAGGPARDAVDELGMPIGFDYDAMCHHTTHHTQHHTPLSVTHTHCEHRQLITLPLLVCRCCTALDRRCVGSTGAVPLLEVRDDLTLDEVIQLMRGQRTAAAARHTPSHTTLPLFLSPTCVYRRSPLVQRSRPA